MESPDFKYCDICNRPVDRLVVCSESCKKELCVSCDEENHSSQPFHERILHTSALSCPFLLSVVFNIGESAAESWLQGEVRDYIGWNAAVRKRQAAFLTSLSPYPRYQPFFPYSADSPSDVRQMSRSDVEYIFLISSGLSEIPTDEAHSHRPGANPLAEEG
ncbi:hypothetical protein OUZ56_010930 [Daphnia magna]|uniref:B box-type domain-containing protein n=1 Tax=Daphnia magna TaxID=35525 RepID=A0ABQ9YYT1_9CRUS|nr:hypothetical protein OUZ56_010930 [Daphnia magna]